jgi:hypothetical protein
MPGLLGALKGGPHGDKENETRAHRVTTQGPLQRVGWLWKRGGRHGGWQNWKKRWVVVSVGRLTYYKVWHRCEKLPVATEGATAWQPRANRYRSSRTLCRWPKGGVGSRSVQAWRIFPPAFLARLCIQLKNIRI